MTTGERVCPVEEPIVYHDEMEELVGSMEDCGREYLRSYFFALTKGRA